MTPSRNISSSRLIGALVVIVTLAVFSAVPHAQFVRWDDDINIYGNPHHGGLTWPRIVWMFTDTHYVLYYAPFSWLALSVIYEFCALNPFGYHFASLLLHGANALLGYYLIRTILSRIDSLRVSDSLLSLAAGIAALCWSIHPLRVEAVAWATGISYLLAGLFSLLSLLLYLRSVAAGQYARPWLGLSIASFLCAILSYPAVMALPAIFVLLDVGVLKRISLSTALWKDRAARGVLLEKVPYFLISGAVLGFTLYRRSQAAGLWSPPVGLNQFGIAERLMQACYVWAWYLWKHLVPLSLAPVYTRLVSFQPFDWPFVTSALFVVSLSTILFLFRKRWSGIALLWLGYLALLVPLLGLTEHPHNTADRYSYLVSLIFSFGFAIVLLRFGLAVRARTVCLALSSAILLGLATACYRQTLVWSDSVTLFQHVLTPVGDHPYRSDIEMRLGAALFETGDFVEGEKHLRQSVKLDPSRFQTHAHLANLLSIQGEFAEAIHEYDTAVSLNPAYVGGLVKKAKLFCLLGKTSAAIDCYHQALARDPNRTDALQ